MRAAASAADIVRDPDSLPYTGDGDENTPIPTSDPETAQQHQLSSLLALADRIAVAASSSIDPDAAAERTSSGTAFNWPGTNGGTLPTMARPAPNRCTKSGRCAGSKTSASTHTLRVSTSKRLRSCSPTNCEPIRRRWYT